MSHRLFHIVLMALAVFMVSAQMACAASDMVIEAGSGHSVHHAEADHDHQDADAPCQDACITHHLVLLPSLADPTDRALSPLEREERPAVFSSRVTAPPYSPPRSVFV